jgi:hypothetical protein
MEFISKTKKSLLLFQAIRENEWKTACCALLILNKLFKTFLTFIFCLRTFYKANKVFVLLSVWKTSIFECCIISNTLHRNGSYSETNVASSQHHGCKYKGNVPHRNTFSYLAIVGKIDITESLPVLQSVDGVLLFTVIISYTSRPHEYATRR